MKNGEKNFSMGFPRIQRGLVNWTVEMKSGKRGMKLGVIWAAGFNGIVCFGDFWV